MKKALIDGARICQVTDKEFPVAAPLQWVDVPDGTTEHDQFVDGRVVKYEPPADPRPEPIRLIERIEQENPITHRASREETLGLDFILRALREKINALDAEVARLSGREAQPLPDIPVSHLLQVVKTVDDLIKAERAKL